MEEISDRAGVENYWPWGPSVGDVNADGWQDVFIASSMDYPHRYGINTMLLNNGGDRFLDSEFIVGIEPRRGGRTHTPWFDMDCSTPPPGHAAEECKGRTGRITVMAPLGSRSSVFFDLDQDGDLDLVTNDFNSEPQILVSNLAQRRAVHWLGCRAGRHDVEPQRARRHGPRVGGRPRADAVERREVGVLVAERPAARTSASATPRRSTASKWTGRPDASRSSPPASPRTRRCESPNPR